MQMNPRFHYSSVSNNRAYPNIVPLSTISSLIRYYITLLRQM